MDVFVARQAIFDKKQNVFGYELFFRSDIEDMLQGPNPDQTTLGLLADTLLVLGMQRVTGGCKAFVQFTRNALVGGYSDLLPAGSLVIELDGSVAADHEVAAACRQAKEQGQSIAVIGGPQLDPMNPLVALADIVKVDFAVYNPYEREMFVEHFAPRGLCLLAENVGTSEEFDEALQLGYGYIQGYIFRRPVALSKHGLDGSKVNYFELLREINKPDLDFDQVDKIIRREVALSYKLLRYINSAAIGLRNQVGSIRQAATLLGVRGMKKWTNMVVLTDLGQDRPNELMVQSVIRARFCETLAKQTGLAGRSEDLFLLGLFSLMDHILEQPLADILPELPIAPDVKAALLGEQNPLRSVFDLVVAYEEGEWETFSERARQLNVVETAIPVSYRSAVEWGNQSLAA